MERRDFIKSAVASAVTAVDAKCLGAGAKLRPHRQPSLPADITRHAIP